MFLLSVVEFQRRYFEPNSRPTKEAIRKWVEAGVLPGLAMGKDVFIDQNAFEDRMKTPYESMACKPKQQAPAPFITNGNPLLEALSTP